MKGRYSFIKIIILSITLMFSYAVNAQIQAESYIDGPMVGAVTDSVTYVNFIVKKGNKGHIFHVALKNITKDVLLQWSSIKEFSMNDTCIYTAEFNNIEPFDKYQALLYKDNIVIDSTVGEISFLPDTVVADFSFITGGGAHIYTQPDSRFKREKVFDQMSSEKDIDFVLWTGDNIYLPYNNLTNETIYRQYLYYKTASKQRADFMRHYFHFGIWDDHDYGYDNATKDFPNKDFSSKIYKIMWPSSDYVNPYNGDTRSIYKYSDADFIMTDSRWYKTRYTNYGKVQMDWIKQQLQQSKATFKFLVLSTATIYPWYYTQPSAETSAWETGERDELFNFIYKNKISGVIILSGDKHKSYFAKYSPDCNSTYPIYEFMTPSLISGPNNSYYGYADIIAQFSINGYGLIKVSGNKGNRECTLTEKDSAGVVVYSMVINENELRVKGDDDFTKVDNKLIAKYDFTGNSEDDSGNNFNAVIDGPILSYNRWGENNSAYIFTKYPDKINFPDTVLNGKVNFSISFWMRPDTNDFGILSAASSIVGNEVMVYYGSTKKISFYIKDKGIYSVNAVSLNKWHNIVVTRNGITGESLIYVDGRIESRDSLPVGEIEVVNFLAGNDQDGAGGGNLDENQQFKGVLDDIAFYDTILCKLKVKEIYEKGVKYITSKTDDTICKPSNVNFKVSGTDNGKYKWYKTKEGNSLIASQVDSIFNVNLKETKTYWVSADNFWKETKRVPVTITVAPKIYTDVDSLIYPSELNCWYTFNGGTKDKTQNYKEGTVNGPVLTTDRKGKENSAYKFSTYPDLITLPSKIIDGAEKFTISFWVKTQEAGRCIISAASSEYGNEFYMFVSAEGSLGIALNNSSKNYLSPTIVDNKWHHILFTVECISGSGVLWVDGKKAIDKDDYFLPGEMEVPEGAFIIGNDQDNPGGGGYEASQQFIGDIDDLIFFRRTLSEKEIQDIYDDNIIYKESFNIQKSDSVVCSGDSIDIILTPVQKGIEYFIENNNTELINKGKEKKDTIIFNLKITKDDEFHIIAKNSFGCKQQFVKELKITAVDSPKPEIIFDGNNLCSNISADKYNWIYNNIEIDKNSKCIQLEGNGTYQLYTTNNSKCISEISEPFVFTRNNIDESRVIIYPNPVKDILTIQINDNSRNIKYRIINILGDIVLQGEEKANRLDIDVKCLKTGVYTININIGDVYKTLKITRY